MKFLLMLAYFLSWMILGAYLESTGIKSPPFYAWYGAAGLGVYLLLAKRGLVS